MLTSSFGLGVPIAPRVIGLNWVEGSNNSRVQLVQGFNWFKGSIGFNWIMGLIRYCKGYIGSRVQFVQSV